MKLKHVLAASLWLVLIAVASCKKDSNNDTQPPQKTTAEKLQAKWSLQSYTLHVHTVAHDTIPAVDTSETVPGSTTDYFEFRADSMLHLVVYPSIDTSLAYSIKNDSTVVISSFNLFTGGDGTYRLRNFTDNTLTLYSSESDPNNAANYCEFSWNLKK